MEESILKLFMILFWGLLLLFTATPVSGFAPVQSTVGNQRGPVGINTAVVEAAKPQQLTFLLATKEEGDDAEEGVKKENPYADPNYPELEFVNYDDPEYQVDQGTGDEFFDPDSTEAQIEEMREDRRRRNDECRYSTSSSSLLLLFSFFKCANSALTDILSFCSSIPDLLQGVVE